MAHVTRPRLLSPRDTSHHTHPGSPSASHPLISELSGSPPMSPGRHQHHRVARVMLLLCLLIAVAITAFPLLLYNQWSGSSASPSAASEQDSSPWRQGAGRSEGGGSHPGTVLQPPQPYVLSTKDMDEAGRVMAPGQPDMAPPSPSPPIFLLLGDAAAHLWSNAADLDHRLQQSAITLQVTDAHGRMGPPALHAMPAQPPGLPSHPPPAEPPTAGTRPTPQGAGESSSSSEQTSALIAAAVQSVMAELQATLPCWQALAPSPAAPSTAQGMPGSVAGAAPRVLVGEHQQGLTLLQAAAGASGEARPHAPSPAAQRPARSFTNNNSSTSIKSSSSRSSSVGSNSSAAATSTSDAGPGASGTAPDTAPGPTPDPGPIAQLPPWPGSSCTSAQLRQWRVALHAAAHGSLRQYLPLTQPPAPAPSPTRPSAPSSSSPAWWAGAPGAHTRFSRNPGSPRRSVRALEPEPGSGLAGLSQGSGAGDQAAAAAAEQGFGSRPAPAEGASVVRLGSGAQVPMPAPPSPPTRHGDYGPMGGGPPQGERGPGVVPGGSSGGGSSSGTSSSSRGGGSSRAPLTILAELGEGGPTSGLATGRSLLYSRGSRAINSSSGSRADGIGRGSRGRSSSDSSISSGTMSRRDNNSRSSSVGRSAKRPLRLSHSRSLVSWPRVLPWAPYPSPSSPPHPPTLYGIPPHLLDIDVPAPYQEVPWHLLPHLLHLAAASTRAVAAAADPHPTGPTYLGSARVGSAADAAVGRKGPGGGGEEAAAAAAAAGTLDGSSSGRGGEEGKGPQGGGGGAEVLLGGLQALMQRVTRLGPGVDCRWDPGLMQHWLGPQGQGQGQGGEWLQHRYLLAFNIRNAERVMPNFLVQVLALVTFLPPGKVLVSGYESSSKDSTATWLHLLQAFLDMARIPSLIVTNGALVRGEDEARIPFLARVRNEALLPLRNATVYHTALARVGRVARPAAPDVGSPDFGFPADRIIFINDVFFCWQDVLRLLLHGADLACGLDFDRPLAPEQMTRAAYDEAKQLSALRQDLLRDLTTKLTRKEFSATLASVAAQTATHASLQQLVNELATVMQPEDFQALIKEVAHAADEQLAVALKVTANSPAFERAAEPDLPPPGVAASIPVPAARQSATAGMWLTPKGSKNASKSVSSPAMSTATQPGAVPRAAGQAPPDKVTAAQSIEALLTLVAEGPAPTVGPRKLEPTSFSPMGGQPSHQQLQSWSGTQGMREQQPGPRRMALLLEAEPNQNQSASASTPGATHTSALPASHSLPHSPSSPSTTPSSHSPSPPSTSTACSPTSHPPSSKCTQTQPDTPPTSSPSSPSEAQPQPQLQAQPRSDPQPSPPASPASPGELPPDTALLLTALLMALQPLPVLLEEVQVVDPQELDYMFYDIWVAHDISGRRFDKGGRLLQHNASAERFAAGMPFPVQCCWNGLAVINAAPFQGLNPEPLRNSPSARAQALDLHAIGERLSAMSNWQRARREPDQRPGPHVSPGPLMFRSAESPSECPASECTHFCNDLWRRGFRRMVVDPWVRMTYEPWRRDTLHDQLLGGIPMLPWAQMQAGLTDTADAGQQASLASLWSAQAPPLLNDCCPIASDSDTVDFDACWGQPHWMNASGSMPWSHAPAEPASPSFAKRMV